MESHKVFWISWLLGMSLGGRRKQREQKETSCLDVMNKITQQDCFCSEPHAQQAGHQLLGNEQEALSELEDSKIINGKQHLKGGEKVCHHYFQINVSSPSHQQMWFVCDVLQENSPFLVKLQQIRV